MATRFSDDLRAAADEAMQAHDFKRSADLLAQFVRAPGAQSEDYLKLAAARRATGDVAGAL